MDLFAGAGGFSLSAIETGFELAFAIENDVHAVATYKANLLEREGARNIKLLDQSILEYSAGNLGFEFFKDEDCDLLLGGPPCQGFSTHRILDAGVNDPRNKLLLAYFEFVKALRPSVFLVENVPGLLWERHSDFLLDFYAEGAKANYHLFPPVTLDARDFGVPQRRKRVFILGVRDHKRIIDFKWPPAATHFPASKASNGQFAAVVLEPLSEDPTGGSACSFHQPLGERLDARTDRWSSWI